MTSIFLSHNHADKKFVKRLASDLREYGVRVWEDEAEMRVGMSLIAEISRGIENMEYLGVVLSPASINSEWVQHETRQALSQEIRSRRIKVLPILLEDCNIPPFLADKLYADFRDDQEYEASLSLLIRAIHEEFSTLDELEKAKSRMKADKEQNQGVSDLLSVVDGLPLTRAWRVALKLGIFSKKFLKIFLDNLVRMRGMTFDFGEMEDLEYPILASSVIAFFRELRRVAVASEEHLKFCCDLVEATEIESKWRKQALGAFIELSDRFGYLRDSNIRLPVFKSGNKIDALLWDLVTGTNVPGDDDSKKLISWLWEKGSLKYRAVLCESLTKIAASVQGKAATYEALRANLTLATEKFSFEEALSELWKIANEDLLHRENLKKLMLPRVLTNEADVLQAFRAASLRAATGRLNALTNEALQALSAECVQVIRHQYDNTFTYRLLARVALDLEVHPMLSALALGRIGESLDLEALLMEDEAPLGFLVKRVEGSQPSVVEFLCKGIREDQGTSLNYLYLIELIHMSIEEDNKEAEGQFIQILTQYSSGCRALEAYGDYLAGSTSFESIEEEFGDTTSAQQSKS